MGRGPLQASRHARIACGSTSTMQRQVTQSRCAHTRTTQRAAASSHACVTCSHCYAIRPVPKHMPALHKALKPQKALTRSMPAPCTETSTASPDRHTACNYATHASARHAASNQQAQRCEASEAAADDCLKQQLQGKHCRPDGVFEACINSVLYVNCLLSTTPEPEARTITSLCNGCCIYCSGS